MTLFAYRKSIRAMLRQHNCVYFERLISECIIPVSTNVEVNSSVIFRLTSINICTVCVTC